MTDFLDLRQLARSHERFKQNHNQAVELSATEAANAGEKLSRRRPGFTPRSPIGGAASRTKGRIIRRRGKVIVRLENDAKHAAILEKGSRPHIIRAKPGKTLRFVKGGKTIFTKAVRHPGTKPYRFLSKGRDVASRKFEQVMRPRMIRAAKSF